MSKLQPLTFVGRKDQLDGIISVVKNPEGCRVILIEGEGGIGKTRLLQKLKLDLLDIEKDKIIVKNIIDCDAPILNDAADLYTQIAKQLSDTTYQEWLPKLRKLRQVENYIGQSAYKNERRQLEGFLVKKINEIARKQKLVFLVDTVEKLGQASIQEEIWSSITDLFHQLDNVLLILAGRPSLDNHPSVVRPTIEHSLKEGEFIYFKLQEFNRDEMYQYIHLKEKQLHFTLGKDLTDKIILLADGSPIMIEFGVEFAYREFIPDWLREDIKILEKSLQKPHGKELFEFKIVKHITQLRTSMDELTLILSRIYPLDVSAIAVFLELPEESAKELFDNAQSYFFIKSVSDFEISLHDIVRDLVNKYVWGEIDPDYEWRKRNSYIASEYFKQKDNDLRLQKKKLESQLQRRLKSPLLGTSSISKTQTDLSSLSFQIEKIKQLRESNTKQWLESALYANLTLGFDTWYQTCDKIRIQTKKFSFVNQLLIIAKKFEDEMNDDQQFKLIIFEAKIVHAIQDKSTTEKETKKLEAMLSDEPSNASRRADLCNVLGMLNRKLHFYGKALEYQQECLSLVQSSNLLSAIPSVANQVGYLYRQVNNYKEAEKYYKLGETTAMHIESPTRYLTQVMASIQNNLGFLYGEQKNYHRSEQCFKSAIDMCLGIETERGIAEAEIASAIISRNQGRYDSAKELLECALTRCTNEVDDNQILCRAYFHLGWNYWFSAEILNNNVWDVVDIKWNIPLLDKSRDYLEKSLELAEKYGIEEELPGIQHQTASVYWYLANQIYDLPLHEKALELNNLSYQTSLDYNDTRYAIDSLVGKAEFDYGAGKYENISNYRQELFERFQNFEDGYSLYFGRILRIEGDIRFKQGDYDNAFTKYAQAIPKIFKHGGAGPYSIQQDLSMLQKKLERIPVDLSRLFILKLKEQWENNTDLNEWCEKQIFLTKLRAAKESSSHDS